MRLDVVLPTFNRSELLERAIASLIAAHRPEGLSVRIIVVDNNSKDDTQATVSRYVETHGEMIRYQFEPKQGRSHALNAGIAASDGDLIGMIDDDERVDENWYRTIHWAFLDNTIDYIGGPYLPDWSGDPPNWIPSEYHGVIGWVDGGASVVTFGPDYPGILMGGNAVIKRSVLQRIGPYSVSLGRRAGRLLSCEDEDMYMRLIDAKAYGLYLPSLMIYHYVPPERLTKSYFRRWCFWRGVSRGVIDQHAPQPVRYLGGIPRYLYGSAVRGVRLRIQRLFRAGSPECEASSFAGELAVWDLAGFFYGKHLYRQ